MALTLVLEYTSKDFFNNSIYKNHQTRGFTKHDLIKSFLFFSKNQDSIIRIGNFIMFWKNSNDFKGKSVSVRVVEKKVCQAG